jgi:hypothetical protein
MNTHPDTTLVIGGEGPESKHLLDKAKELELKKNLFYQVYS